MSSIKNAPVDREIAEIFSRFFDGEPAEADVIDTSREEDDFRNTIIITTRGGEKYVLKFAANDFTFPEKIRMWQRTVEEYRALGYYCPRIFADRNGEFPSVSRMGRECFVFAEEFSIYRPLEDRASCEEDAPEADSSAYFDDMWAMTAKIAAKRFDYTEYPSAYCLFETFCPSDEVDEVLENALEWKKTADALPSEFAPQVQRIWRLWCENREALKAVYDKLPASVFQADLNSTNLLIGDDGKFKGVYDFNLSGKDVFLNYLMRENTVDTIPKALLAASRYYEFTEEEKAAALPMLRCLKALWYSRVRELKKAGDDPEKIRGCLDFSEKLLTEEKDLAGFMERPEESGTGA